MTRDVSANLKQHVSEWYLKAYGPELTEAQERAIDCYSTDTACRAHLLLGDMLSSYDASPPKKVLDVGCGYGSIPLFLAARWPTAEVLATDVAERYFWVGQAAAERSGVSNIEFRVADLRRLDVGRFDLITCCNVLNFMNSPEALRQACGKLMAALRPDGGLFINTPHRWCFFEPFTGLPLLQFLPVRMQDRIARSAGRRSLMTDNRHPSVSELKKLFAGLGGEVALVHPAYSLSRLRSSHVRLWVTR